MKNLILFFLMFTAINSFSQVTPLSKCPKNYMQTFPGAPQSSLNPMLTNVDFVGGLRGYLWKDLEPTKDVYDLSAILSDLNYVQAAGKHLMIQLGVKSFGFNPSPLPAYILTDPEYAGGEVVSSNGTHTIKRWNTNVIIRLKKLYQKLADTLNSRSFYDGFVLSESAGGPTSCSSPGDYTIIGLRDGIIQDMKNARNSFSSNKIIIQYLNYLSCPANLAQQLSYLKQISDTAVHYSIGFGGPDISLITPNPVDSYQRLYNGLTKLADAVQIEDYGYINPHTGDTVRAEEIIHYGADTLKDDIIFWLNRSPYYANDVVPTLAIHRNDCQTGIGHQSSNVTPFTISHVSGETIINFNSNYQDVELTLYNVLGKVIKEYRNISGSSIRISYSDLPSGIYFIRLMQINNSLGVVKFMVTH